MLYDIHINIVFVSVRIIGWLAFHFWQYYWNYKLNDNTSVIMKRILLPSLKHIKCIRTALSLRTTVSALQSPSSSSFNISGENCDSSCIRYNWRSFSDIHLGCDPAHELPEESNRNVTMQEQSEKEKIIKSASLKDLMQIAPTVGTPFQASLVLQRLNILHKEDINFDPVMILEDPCMSRVVEIFDNNISKIPPKLLISCLNVLYEITSRDIFLIKTLITQVTKYLLFQS